MKGTSLLFKLRTTVALFACVSALLVAKPTHAFYSNNVVLSEQLSGISRQMAEERNTSFLIVEAIRDSLIIPGQHYEFVYEPGKVKVNGKVVPQPLHERYLSMINSFYHKDTTPGVITRLSIESDGVSLKDVLDPASSFRKVPEQPKADNYSSTYKVDNTSAVMADMGKDGLLGAGRKVHISYSSKGLFVNGSRLKAPYEAIYLKRFKELTAGSAGRGSIDITTETTIGDEGRRKSK